MSEIKKAWPEDNRKIDNTQDDQTKTAKKDANKLKIDYWTYFKIIIVLALVIAVIYGISLLMKKMLKIKGEVGDGATILVSHSLGPGKWLQVVSVLGKYLVLGITNDRISLLSEITDPKEIERLEVAVNESKANEGASFIDIFSDFIKKKFHKSDKEKFNYETDSVDFLKSQRERLDKLNDK